ncbi:uncharacterized protein LOC108626209 [Ceratina calcarata]|uniref:Uncharacterized protein LOC108626209 n=1 Tax=Ceratina calcarata TaxID=156304 RepID=A0AAJ7N7Z8_9HYME|nr:uncharacterized protein LOC108626209 [Ceratina calcarata]XP_017882253.1 uncharacterized protein LOC108626209 [Ceratina calcarata]XP_026670348.1 uncharacterized protein LOC108626209 [Ceratina calcarata]
MSNKASSASKTVVTRSNKNILENNHHLPTSAIPPEGYVLYDNCNTLIEVKVKTKGQKRTSTMVSSSPNSHKGGVGEKRKPSCSGDTQSNWGRILREQNKSAMKQGLQQLMVKGPGSKSSKLTNETKETKKSGVNHNKQDPKHLDEIPVKQSASQKRIEEHTKLTPRTGNPSSTSIQSSVESVIVIDKGVQCDVLFDPDDRFGVYNPVRTLSFLIKELEHLVKDDKASKILINMEQALFRIPIEYGKSPGVDMEAIELRGKLEATTLQLEKMSKQMNLTCEALCEERDSLQRQIQKQVVLLNEGREKQSDLETTVKALKQELQDAIKAIEDKEKAIASLTEEINDNFSQKVIADLRANVAEQTELARQRHLEVQYLMLEKDKLLVLSSYKDTLLNELRNAIKELQSHIGDQLNGLKDIYNHAETANPQISLVHGGIAFSSPTSTSSHDSIGPTSWHDISDISLSTVDHDPPKDKKQFLRVPNSMPGSSEILIENSEKKRTKNVKESPTRDSSNMEFISLRGGESSLTLMPSYKEMGYSEISKSVNKDKEGAVTLSNQKNDNVRNYKSTDNISLAKDLNSDNVNEKESSKNKRSVEVNKRLSFGKKSVAEDVTNILKDNSPHHFIGSTITEEFQNIFQGIRIQSRMPVNIPSPPRSYPHPEWSDSTLPSISTASDLNMVQANDI